MDVTIGYAHFLTAPAGLYLGQTAMSGSQIVILALAVGALTIVMISTYRRTRARRFQPDISVRERYAELQKKSAATRDLEQIILELDQLARQIHGRIDTRFAKLEAVIRDADERIDKLDRLVRAAQGQATFDVTLEAEDSPKPSPSVNEETDSRRAAIYRLADGGLSVAQIGQEVGKTAGEVELILALRRTRAEADQLTTPVAQSRQD